MSEDKTTPGEWEWRPAPDGSRCYIFSNTKIADVYSTAFAVCLPQVRAALRKAGVE